MPHPLNGSPPREVKTAVGQAWSGVVAEFSSEVPAINPTYPYKAEIEWGGSEPHTSGTINVSAPGSHTFSVSGSFAYSHPLAGQISVAIWHGSQLLGRWATSSVDVEGKAVADLTPPAPLRLSGRSILAVIHRAGRAPRYELVLETSQRLPTTASGRVQAQVDVNGRSSEVEELSPGGMAGNGPRCYVADANAPEGRKSKSRTAYPFALVFRASRDMRLKGHALRRGFSSLARMRSVAGRVLGCS
jgi:hypothetical protein